MVVILSTEEAGVEVVGGSGVFSVFNRWGQKF